MLKEFGPYTTPLAVAMAYVIIRLAKELKAERTEVRRLLIDRGDHREQAQKDYMEYGEVMRNTLRDFAIAAQALLARG
jgi:hypothetical protein